MTRLTRVAIFLCGIALVLGSCSGGDGDARDRSPVSIEPSPATRMAPPTPGAGCTDPDRPESGDSAHTVTVDDVERSYVLHVPPGYDGTTPLPLVLNLHGFGSSGQQQARYSRFPAFADEERFFVASPDGAGQPQQWNIRRQATLPDDVAFVRVLLDELQTQLCIDRGRIFAAGISNGAAFAQQLACAMPERFAAVAAVAALVYPALCATDQPVALIAFHGTADACVPFDGGPVTCGSARGVVRSVEEGALNWARHNGCTTTASRARVTEHVRSIAYSECDGETAVVVFVIQGGGHTWPGSIEVSRLGPTTQEIDATEQIWQFFSGQADLR